ncbi:MAG: hypothetical protein FJ088_14550, partial [Deltaproteobacteria bacterium]|nr:hypothetical protein [Deltaproteobacteria bacterium]
FSIIGGSKKQQDEFIKAFQTVAYFVVGSFRSPYFLADKDGAATEKYPADDDESFDVDPVSGKAFYGGQYVTFICAIPKESGYGSQPFPVAFVAHGYTGNRMDAFMFSGFFTRFGFAACGIDAQGHGLEPLEEIILLVADGLGIGDFIREIHEGRARDLNNDGDIESGGDYWNADGFHSRDAVRQTLVDYMQFIRILRSFDGNFEWNLGGKYPGTGKIAGDFNNDGKPDLGGDGERYFATGGSLGGIISGSLAGIEPALKAAAPIVGGGGLIDIGMRSTQGGVPEAVILPLIGPFISGNTSGDGKTEFKFLVNDVNSLGRHPFHYTEEVGEGDIIIAENLANGEESSAIVMNSGFRLGLPCDSLLASEKRHLLGLKDDSPVEPLDNPSPFLFGDPLRVKVIDGKTGIEKAVIDKFGVDVV